MQGLLLIAFPQILIIAAVVFLLVMLASVSIKNTQGPMSVTALKRQLQLLQSKFANATLINPELERAEMEKLQNKIKTSCNPEVISGNVELKTLFASNCQHIESALKNANQDNRSSWIKFKEMMFNFNYSYYQQVI